MHEQVQQIIDRWAQKRANLKEFTPAMQTSSMALETLGEVMKDAWEDLWFIKRLVNQSVMMEKNLVFRFRGQGNPLAIEMQNTLIQLEAQWTYVDVVSVTSSVVSDLTILTMVVKVKAYAKNPDHEKE